jgi:lambda repressor-like predicted transcriptional regulator
MLWHGACLNTCMANPADTNRAPGAPIPVPNERLRHARLARGWSMRRLAREAGIAPPTVYNAEVGFTRTTPSMRKLLSQALSIPAEDLFPDAR